MIWCITQHIRAAWVHLSTSSWSSHLMGTLTFFFTFSTFDFSSGLEIPNVYPQAKVRPLSRLKFCPHMPHRAGETRGKFCRSNSNSCKKYITLLLDSIMKPFEIRQHTNTTAHIYPCRTVQPNISAAVLTASCRATIWHCTKCNIYSIFKNMYRRSLMQVYDNV